MAYLRNLVPFLLFVLGLIGPGLASFQVQVNKNGSAYKVNVDGKTWLENGDTWFNANNQKYSQAAGNLKFNYTYWKKGVDVFGEYKQIFYGYATKSSFKIELSVKTYSKLPNLAIFSQKYVHRTNGTQAKSTDDTIGSYPSFVMPREDFAHQEVDLGYISYGKDMAGWVGLNTGKWSKKANFYTGIKGGPLILFDKGNNAVVISPLNHFTSVSDMKTDREKDAYISWGFMGGIKEVPVNFTVDVIVYYSNQGINRAVSGWGDYITRLYGKTSERKDKDLSLTHLGYWTDNGAYYYYNTEKDKNYEETMLDVVEYLRKNSIPAKYLQIDSWFYKKGHEHGTHSWTPMKSIFPHGFDGLYEKTKLPIGCHNRYWDNDTIYADYNGGKYQFISDTKTGYAAVYDQDFWMDLFRNATGKWGKFILYEQDWFNKETDRNKVLLTDISFAREWMKNMGKAADFFNVSIQYCMEYSRHILQSVEVKAVTQARASDDYKPGNEQWRIGITAMFLDAVKLAPSKDTFWTTSVQPGNRYNTTEKVPYLQTLMATLSKGPVGPGDGIGYMNRSLLMKCCDSDGLVLKPTRPVTAMDAFMQRLAFNELSDKTAPHKMDEFAYTTYTDITRYFFLTVVAGFIKNPYSLTLDMGWRGILPSEETDYVIYDAKYERPENFHIISNAKPFSLGGPKCQQDYCFYQASPILWREETGGVVLFGEVDKFVSMSPQRFSMIQYTNEDNIKVYLNVNAREIVTFTYLKWDTQALQKVVCDNSKVSKQMAQSFIQFTNKADEASCKLES